MGGFLPWTLFLPPLVHSMRQRLKKGIGEEKLFLVLWVATVFCFFSLSRNKLGGYILPLFPPLALLMGDFLRQATEPRAAKDMPARWIFGGALLWLLSVLFLSPITQAVLSKRDAQLLPFDPPISPSVLLLVLLVSAQWLRRQRWVPWIVCFSVVWISAWLFSAKADDIAAVKGARSLALLVDSSAIKDFRAVALHAESFSFYLNTPVRDVLGPDVIDQMLQEPIPTVALVKERHIKKMNWDDSNRVFIWKRIPREAAVIANFPYKPANNGSAG
jgi:4-amino-4-deoxy-L-arabinose transferase-like glycosyltransferase